MVGDFRRRAVALRRGQRRQRAIVLARDGLVRERRDVVLHVLEIQRVQQHVASLSVPADGARHSEQNDRENDEDAQHHAEGIEEMGI